MNLTYLGLCLACFGVSLAEGMGIAFIEGTFFVTLVMAFIIK